MLTFASDSYSATTKAKRICEFQCQAGVKSRANKNIDKFNTKRSANIYQLLSQNWKGPYRYHHGFSCKYTNYTGKVIRDREAIQWPYTIKLQSLNCSLSFMKVSTSKRVTIFSHKYWGFSYLIQHIVASPRRTEREKKVTAFNRTYITWH